MSTPSTELVAEIDRALDPARERMRQAAPESRALYPTEYDWMTTEEREHLAALVLRLPRSGVVQAEARERVARRRAERLAAMVQPEKSYDVELKFTGRAVVRVIARSSEEAIDLARIKFDDNNASARVVEFDPVDGPAKAREVKR